ncbi:MAG: type II secretion system protein [Verrucomicrobiales bacterium]
MKIHRPQSASPRRCHRAFTLTELMVCIGIIALLAALITGAIPRIKENAHRARCANNIRQQLIGIRALSTDHNNEYYWPAATSGDDSAPSYLYPEYVDDLNVFICPSTHNKIRNRTHPVTGIMPDLLNNAVNAGSYYGHSYEYFGYYTKGRKSPRHMTALPETIVLVVDGDDYMENNMPDISNNHGPDGWNWGYADGHVEWITRAETQSHFQRIRFND